MSLDLLKPLAEVLQPDERWRWFNCSLEDHHRLVASIQVNESAPEDVRQQFENARNTWLYAFFAYGLLTVALATVHVACETAVKARAKMENLPGWEKKRLYELLDIAITKRWLVDSGFAAAGNLEAMWERDRNMKLEIGAADIGPYVKSADDQAHAKNVVKAVRELRNALVHGEPILINRISGAFRAAADLINQLFPQVEK